MKKISLKIVVLGQVQMVGFRWYVKRQADILGIKGYVKNSSRGEVEILAQGDSELMPQFLDHIKIGPSRSRVDRLQKEELITDKIFDNFLIRM
jgi:acylphosphatase